MKDERVSRRNLEMRKILTIPGLELRSLGRPMVDGKVSLLMVRSTRIETFYLTTHILSKC
jgi:hypothetical protein